MKECLYIDEGPSPEYPAILVVKSKHGSQKEWPIARAELDSLVHDGQTFLMDSAQVTPETEMELAYWEDAKEL